MDRPTPDREVAAPRCHGISAMPRAWASEKKTRGMKAPLHPPPFVLSLSKHRPSVFDGETKNSPSTSSRRAVPRSDAGIKSLTQRHKEGCVRRRRCARTHPSLCLCVRKTDATPQTWRAIRAPRRVQNIRPRRWPSVLPDRRPIRSSCRHKPQHLPCRADARQRQRRSRSCRCRRW